MKAIILAAGRGSRMEKLTDERPKCLLEIRGRTLLDWQLSALAGAGITEIAIVTGYKRELLADRGLVEFYNPRWAETNMVSSLECAQTWLQAQPCIVSYSDIFYGSTIVRSLMTCSEALAIAYDPQWLELWTRRFGNPLLDAETFKINAYQMLVEIGCKPSSVEEIEGQYMGLLRLTPESWCEALRVLSNLTVQQRSQIHMTNLLQKIIDARHTDIRAVPCNEEWGEVDTEKDFSICDKFNRRVGEKNGQI